MESDLEDVNVLHREILKNKKFHSGVNIPKRLDEDERFCCLQQDEYDSPTVTFLSVIQNGETL